MIYSALCLDNTKYATTGKITVRVFEWYVHPHVMGDEKTPTEFWDLKNDPDSRLSGKTGEGEITEDFEAFVFAPLGGGRNYGMFNLPEINERGIVSFLDGDFHKPVWMGSYFTPIRDKDKKFLGVNIPTDKIDDNEVKDGVVDGDTSASIENIEKKIVLRTKHTTGNDKDTLDWTKQNTENLIVLGDSLIRVRHHTAWDDNHITQKYQEILIYVDADEKEAIQLDVNNLEDEHRGTLKLTEDGLTITLVGENGTSTIDLSIAEGGGINLTDQDGNQIIGTDTGLVINAVDGDESIDLNGDNDFFVRYSDLKEALDLLKAHVHAGAIIVKAPLVSDSNRGPLTSKIDNLLTKMKVQKVKTYDKD